MPDNVDASENTYNTEEKIRDSGSVQKTVSEQDLEVPDNY